MENTNHKWTTKDKRRYYLSMLPVFLMLIGTSYILLQYSIFMPLLWWLIYLIINLFQAGCCIGCPYRGKYCPAFFGVYIGNKLSSFLYKDFDFELRTFKKYALGGEISLAVFLIYPLYWLYINNWYYVLIYLALVVIHVVIFAPTQCRNCSNNETCPSGNSYRWMCRLFRYKSK